MRAKKFRSGKMYGRGVRMVKGEKRFGVVVRKPRKV